MSWLTAVEPHIILFAGAQPQQQQPGKLDAFDPPGFLEDLAPENKPGWSATISEFFENAR